MTGNENALKALHDLIATSNDAAEGFGKAAKGVHDRELSDWLAAASSQREAFSADLAKELKNMGEEPRLDLHVGGILHKRLGRPGPAPSLDSASSAFER